MLENIIKAYDIRGLVKNEITPDFSFALGVAFAKFLEQEREPATIVVGEDMRESSPQLADAFTDGATSQGMDVIRIGLASTDMLYFASGKLNLPGIMFTASHNPAKYNGMKLCKSGARPIGQDTGLQSIRELIEKGVPISNRPVGSSRKENLLKDYANYLLAQFPKNTFKKRKLKVVIDAGNGMAGFTAPAVMSKIDIDLIRESLKDLLALQDKLVTIDNIQRVVADYYKLKMSDMLSKRRSRSVARPRQMAMSIAKELTSHSLPEIGESFGGRDHTTVMYAIKKVGDLMKERRSIYNYVTDIMSGLK